MVKRKNIGLFFSYNEGWIGGTYYILSLINALNTLSDDLKPNLIIICDSDKEFGLVQQTNYPYLIKHPIQQVNFQGNLSIVDRVINKLSSSLFHKYLVNKQGVLNYKEQLDGVFPCSVKNTFSDAKKSIFWIPDFQEFHLPHFFSKEEITRRFEFGKYVSENTFPLVLSSNDAYRDFNVIYPKNKSEKYIIPFAVTHDDYKNLDITFLREKYKLQKPYFFSPNQIWKHKNHSTVIDAASILVNQGITDFQIAFSGKESDFRNPDYIIELKQKIKDLHLENYVYFLGFIDRAEQLQLMNNALSIIQPSLFEGWSTVIEDAKSMNQPIIASDLEVHEEQLTTYGGSFFQRQNAMELAVLLKKNIENPLPKVSYNYSKDVQQFAQKFIDCVGNLL